MTRALWFLSPRNVEIRDEPARAVGPKDVLVRGLASGISQGTELLLYRGEGPTPFDPSLPDVDTYPTRYGYSWVGEVASVGPESTLAVGTHVFALAPHGDAHVLPQDRTWVLPNDVPPTRGVLAANLETAITTVWDSELAFGDRCIVFGGGVVGLLTTWLLERAGAEVTLVERSAARRATAKRFLVKSAIGNHRIIESITTDDEGRSDRVFEVTGDPRTLDDAIRSAAFEARVVVASFYGTRRAPIDLGKTFHRQRLELRASQVSNIPPRLRPRWDEDRRFSLVTKLLAEPALDDLLATPVPFEKAPELYARLDAPGALDEAAPAHVFVYR